MEIEDKILDAVNKKMDSKISDIDEKISNMTSISAKLDNLYSVVEKVLILVLMEYALKFF